MARIAEDVIERLKLEVSVERLVQGSGVELKRHGSADLIGRCPFHEDKTPSLVISPKKNLWHCLGACQTGGTVIDWVMKAERVSFRRAVELLRGELSGSPGLAVPAPPPAEALASPDAEDRELLAQVVDYYHATLKASPEALAYLGQRGIRSPEAIDHFKLGFANRTLTSRLPVKQVRAGLEARSRLQHLGVLRDTGHEHFNGSLVIPILGEDGEVLGLYGRKITPGLRKGTPLHLYLPGPHRGVFGAAALPPATKEVILCEALIDALTFWCAGFRNILSTYGAAGFTADHLEAIERRGVTRVYLAHDRDEAGDRGAAAAAAQLMARGIECLRVQFPKGVDVNAYACREQPAAQSLAALLRNAVWLGAGPDPGPRRSADDAATPTAEADEPTSTDDAAPAAPSEPEPTPPGATSSAPVLPSPPEPSPVAVEPALADPVLPQPLPSPSPSTPGRCASPAPPSTPPPTPSAVKATASARPALELDATGDEATVALGDRRYRIRGLSKNTTHGALRVNVLASKGDAVHVDTLDLYSARQRGAFVRQASSELGVGEEVIKRDVGQLLLRVEALQDERIAQALAPNAATVELTEDERDAALELLRAPDLLDRILVDFATCGVVGEETNKLLGYLAAVSRKLDEPLAVIIQSSSAAGKTSLMEAVLAFMPEEERVKYSAMTGQSLFYMGESDLKHKILAIVEEAGAERAAYALKLLQSEGELTIASTGKDPASGRLVTHEYRVEGPVMIFLTTTAVEIDEELLNRCLVLTVDEDREQTRAIHRLQRERQTLEGLLARRARPRILKVHQDAQRLLKPILVANPYARHLTFLDDRTRTRRDHVKYLTLIRTIALLHQYQREVKTVSHGGEQVPYIDVTLADIAIANRVAHQVLGRSLDELAPQTRRLLDALEALVGAECEQTGVVRGDARFTRRRVRESSGLSYEQVRVHLDRLVQLEYVLAHSGGRGQSYEYELLYDGGGRDGAPFLCGLLDVERLGESTGTTGGLGGQEVGFGVALGGHTGLIPAPYRTPTGVTLTTTGKAESHSAPKSPKNAHLDEHSELRRSRTRGNRNGQSGAAIPGPVRAH